MEEINKINKKMKKLIAIVSDLIDEVESMDSEANGKDHYKFDDIKTRIFNLDYYYE